MLQEQQRKKDFTSQCESKMNRKRVMEIGRYKEGIRRCVKTDEIGKRIYFVLNITFLLFYHWSILGKYL